MDKKRKSKILSFLLSFMLVIQIISGITTSYADGKDISDKVTIDKITAKGEVDGVVRPINIGTSNNPNDYD